MTGTPEQLLPVAVESFLVGPPDRVFDALTRPDLYVQWMGPEGSKVTVDAMEPVQGGDFAIRVGLAGGGEVAIRGRYLTVDPPNHLSHTWQVGEETEVTTVTFHLHAHPRGTHLVLTHTGFGRDDVRQRNDAGWRHQLARLARVLEPVSGALGE